MESLVLAQQPPGRDLRTRFKMFWTLASFACIIGSVISAPNDLKAAAVDGSNGAAAGGLGASASWGGFSASAGLGGTALGAGGLGAAAKTPHSDVAAGVGAGSSAGAVGTIGLTKQVVVGPGPPEGTFFDRIFNIPISILHSVNDHLRTRGAVRKGVVVTANAGTAGAVEHTPVASASNAEASAAASAGVGSDHKLDVRSGGGGHTGVAAGSVVVAQKPQGFYDSVFNIPISALRSVNQLLNG